MSNGDGAAEGLAPAATGTVGHTAWESYGDGPGVPLLLLHGVTDSGACWRPLVPRWSAERVVVTVDARGHGRSVLQKEPFTIAALADDAAAVAREVLGRPAVVLGHSLGGLTAQELALSSPDVVAALILEDPAWRSDRETDAAGVPGFLHVFVRSFAGSSRGELETRSRVENPGWPDDEHGPWAASKRQLDQGLVDVPHEWDARDWVASLAQVQVPVTLVTGDPARGAIVDEDQVRRARELLGSRLTHAPVPVAGHSVRREAREPFLAAVQQALEAADVATRTT